MNHALAGPESFLDETARADGYRQAFNSSSTYLLTLPSTHEPGGGRWQGGDFCLAGAARMRSSFCCEMRRMGGLCQARCSCGITLSLLC